MSSRINIIAEDYLAQRNLDLLRSKHGVLVNVFFDNSVIRGMIQGISSIESGYKIEKDKFDSKQLLVQSLAYFNLIKNIKLLPPHQDELVDFLSKKHSLPDINKFGTKDIINNLLYTVELNDIDKLKEYKEKGQIDNYIEKFKHKAVDLFKINYLLKDIRWNDRLKKIISFSSPSIITIDNSTYDLNKSIESKLFKKLIGYFDSERTFKRKNNFRDALSLTLINEMIQEYSENNKVVPIFYASTHVIRQIKENEAIAKEFDIEIIENGEKFNISTLRDSYFFLLDSLFQMVDNDKIPSELFKRFEYLDTKFKNGTFHDIYSKANLGREIENLIFRDKFFLEVWFERLKKENIDTTIDDIVNYDFLRTDKKVLEIVEKDRRHFSNKLSENLDKLKLIEDLWLILDHSKEFINTNFKRKTKVDIFTDLGLTRFSLVRCEEIQDVFDIFLRFKPNYDTDELHHAKTKLITYALNGIYEKKYEDLLVTIAILWIFEKRDVIIQLLNMLNYDYGNCYQLALMHAASIPPVNEDAEDNIIQILKSYDEKTFSCYKWIGEGFIYYHMWKRNAGQVLFPEKNIQGNANFSSYIFKAIEKTEKAFLWLKTNKDIIREHADYRNRKYYYALNNLLYFKVRIGKSTEYEDWKELADELRHCKDIYKAKYWQSRFDHTLAIYEFRLYKIKKTNEAINIKGHLLSAKKYISESLKGIAILKEDYEKLRDEIVLSLEQDFPKKVAK